MQIFLVVICTNNVEMLGPSTSVSRRRKVRATLLLVSFAKVQPHIY